MSTQTTLAQSLGDNEYESSDALPILGHSSPNTSAPYTKSSNSYKQVEWVVFTARYPYVFDAARLGYSIGRREDSSYQWSPSEVSLPIHFLDNKYWDSDLARFRKGVRILEPEIAVVGDIYTEKELDPHLDVAEELQEEYPEMNLILVPKTEEVLHQIPNDFILGYPNGASDIQGDGVAPSSQWQTAGNDIHILGGTPLQIREAINKLTTPRFNAEPANIIGLDCNRFIRWAHQYGDYASIDGGTQRNLRTLEPSYRATILYSLINAREFWLSEGIWPSAHPLTPRSTFREILTNDDPLDSSPDTIAAEVLAETPLDEDYIDDPLCRTDDTRDRTKEPLSPQRRLESWSTREIHWVPDGSCSGPAKYTQRSNFTAGHCAGCGRHIGRDYTQAEQIQGWFDPRIVYYQVYEADNDESMHFGSAAKQAPEHLNGRLNTEAPLTSQLYCCDRCQDRTETEKMVQVTPDTSSSWCATVTTIDVETGSA